MREPSVRLRRDGFAIIPAVFTAQAMEQLLDDACLRAANRSRAGIRHAMSIPVVSELAKTGPLPAIAREILGPNAFPFRATVFDKSGQSNWLVVWHQDTALPLHEKHETKGWGPWSVKDGIHYAHAPASVLREVVALRMHLDDSTEMNGPLRVLPRTHTSEVLSDDAIHELAGKIKPTTCVVSNGGVIAMRPLLIHSSSKSKVDAPRRVLHLEYAASEAIANPLRLRIA